MPSEGATSVPTNTELRVLYFGTLMDYTPNGTACDLPLARMRLVDDEGAAIEFEARAEEAGELQRWMVARPLEPLRANTRYRLQTQISGDPCVCSEPAAYADISDFTTGERIDGEPPDVAVLDRLALADLVDATSTCGRTFGYPVDATFAAAAPTDVSFDVHVDGELVKRYVASFENELFVSCGSVPLTLQTVLLPGSRVRLRAIDLAGNMSPLGPEVAVDADCSRGGGAAGHGDAGGGTAPVAGSAAARGDAGDMRGPSEAEAITTASGCTVAGAGSPGALIGWLVALAAVFVRLRRFRSCGPPSGSAADGLRAASHHALEGTKTRGR